MTRKLMHFPLVCAILAASADLASAAFFRNATGIAAPAVTITFDEYPLADQTPILTQYANLGISSTSNLYFHNFPFGSHVNGNTNVVGNFVWNLQTGQGYVSPFSLHFAVDQTAVGLAISGQATSAHFEALLNGVVVDSGIADIGFGPTVDDYYGFTGGVFDEIRISAGGSAIVADVDNIQLSAIPEPSTCSIALLGLLGLVAFRRKLACR